MYNHNKKLLHVAGLEADIDLAIYDLIRELWIADLMTVDACESVPELDMIGITFSCSHNAESFLSIIKTYDDGSAGTLSDRALSFSHDDEDSWHLTVGLCVHDEVSLGEEVSIGIRILIPQSDYDEVLLRMQDYNS